MKNRNVVVNYQVILNRGLYRWAAPRNVFVRGLINDGIQDLQRLSCSLRNCVRGRFQIKFAMTSLFNKSGFTLIELLVVVLIIGILAAIALPQYQKAVEKSRVAEAVTVLNNLRKSYQLCVLEYGRSDDSNVHQHPCGINFFKHITIDIPGSKGSSSTCDATDCIITRDWHYDYDGFYLDAYRLQNGDPDSAVYQIEIELPNGQFICKDNETSGSCQKICGSNNCVLK